MVLLKRLGAALVSAVVSIVGYANPAAGPIALPGLASSPDATKVTPEPPVASPGHPVEGRNVRFQIAAEPRAEALRDFAEQAAVLLVMPVGEKDEFDNSPVPALDGVYSVQFALRTLLAGSGLAFEFVGENSARITQEVITVNRVPQFQSIPDVLVTGKRTTLNTDLERTRRQTQPYTVIEREKIERAGAASIASIIGLYAPSNMPGDGSGQVATVGAPASQINLRGLGARDSLVLIDGRRDSQLFIGGTEGQPNLRAIPRSLIDHIEVLPMTASGIYGGSATAGVLNIVLRHDCAPAELSVDYGNSFRTDSRNYSVSGSACLAANDDRLELQVFGSLSAEAGMRTRDQPFMARGRAHILQNYPDFFQKSALPPLGGQINLRTADGSGLAGPGSPDFTSIPDGYTSSMGAGPLLKNAGTYNLLPARSAQSDGGEDNSLWDGVQTRYFEITLTQKLSDAMNVYLDATTSSSIIRNRNSVAEYVGFNAMFIPAGADGNVLEKDLIAAIPAPGSDGLLENRRDAHRVTAGFNYTLSPSWTLGLEATMALYPFRWHQLVASSAEDAVANGDLNVFRDVNRYPIDLASFTSRLSTSELKSRGDTLSLRAAGSLFELSAGDVTMVALVEHQKAKFGGGLEIQTPLMGDGQDGVPVTALTKQSQSTTSGYVEIHIPLGTLVEDGQRAPRVELQIAGRLDKHSTDAARPRTAPNSAESREHRTSSFTTVNPTLGIAFRPHMGLTLRASVATGFLPASGDQVAPPTSRQFDIPDPRRNNEPTGPVDFFAGGNPLVRPERSESWSTGFVFEPVSVPKLQVSVDYVAIQKTNKIVSPADDALTRFDQFEIDHPDRVIRAPLPVGDAHGAGPVQAIDATNLNIAESQIKGLDGYLRYGNLELPRGSVTFEAHVTRHLMYETRATPESNAVDELALTATSPPRIVGAATLTYAYQNLSAGLAARYYGSYRVGLSDTLIQSQGSADVEDQMYVDLSVTCHVRGLGPGITSGMDIQLNLYNVLNHEPPVDLGVPSYYSPLGDPRLARYSLSFRKRF